LEAELALVAFAVNATLLNVNALTAPPEEICAEQISNVFAPLTVCDHVTTELLLTVPVEVVSTATAPHALDKQSSI
jgi:hypothetical protein